MSDSYVEETLAKLSSEVKRQVNDLRALGEKQPVVLVVTTDGGGSDILGRLGVQPLPDPGIAVTTTIRKEMAIDLLNRFVSLGLGTRMLGFTVAPEHGFPLVLVLPATVHVWVMVIEEGHLFMVGGVSVDIHTRHARLLDAAGMTYQEGNITW